MRTSDFNFDLPPHLIAQSPAEPRDAARLMVLDPASATLAHRRFHDLPSLLRRGDLLVVNDTRVMAARLVGRRADTGGGVEALLVRPFTDRRWEVMLRPAKAVVPGRRFVFGASSGDVVATAIERTGDTAVIEFDTVIDPATVGSVPLPPYIRGYEGDPERYQTVYSREPRSAAAPTAGLHFTPAVFDALDAAGVERAFLTLEVGPGTFAPIRGDDPRAHTLHTERYHLPAVTADAINAARASGRRVIAVGTTSVRVLEHIGGEGGGEVAPGSGETGLMILPGYRFTVVDGMITNFHLPQTSLLMLVCALAGQEFVLHAYREAVEREYRFYSFGDAMLLLPGVNSPASAQRS